MLLFGLILLVLVGPRRGRSFWLLAAAGLAALVWQLMQAAPYLPGWPKEVASATTCPRDNRIRLLNANVLMTNRDFGTLSEKIEQIDPDIVLLLETGPEWARMLRPNYDRYPYRIGQPIPNTYGIMLLSKLPLERAEIRYLLQPHIPSVKARVHLPSGAAIDFYGLHPEPPVPGDDSGERDAELVMAGREVRQSGRAAIVLGDLNDVAWSASSRLFRKLSGMRDPRVGRGFYPTFPVRLPLLGWPLDHGFVTPHFKVLGIDRLGKIGSDHWPMLFDLCLTEDPDRRMMSRGVDEEVREDAADQAEDGMEERLEESRDD